MIHDISGVNITCISLFLYYHLPDCTISRFVISPPHSMSLDSALEPLLVSIRRNILTVVSKDCTASLLSCNQKFSHCYGKEASLGKKRYVLYIDNHCLYGTIVLHRVRIGFGYRMLVGKDCHSSNHIQFKTFRFVRWVLRSPSTRNPLSLSHSISLTRRSQSSPFPFIRTEVDLAMTVGLTLSVME